MFLKSLRGRRAWISHWLWLDSCPFPPNIQCEALHILECHNGSMPLWDDVEKSVNWRYLSMDFCDKLVQWQHTKGQLSIVFNYKTIFSLLAARWHIPWPPTKLWNECLGRKTCPLNNHNSNPENGLLSALNETGGRKRGLWQGIWIHATKWGRR